MSDDTLKPDERAALLLLTAVAAEVGNPDLKERFGVTLTGRARTRLNDLKLVTSRKIPGSGTALFHEPTDPGWARARQELTGELPIGRWSRSVAYALSVQLDRYLDRADLRLSDVFAATDAGAEPPGDSAPAADTATSGVPDLDGQIRAAYWSLAPEPNASIILTDLRALLPEVGRDELDAALRRLDRAPDVTLAPESNRKSLREADKAAAITIGRQHMHLLSIERA